MSGVPQQKPRRSGASNRLRGRELALKYLYACDASGMNDLSGFDEFLESQEAGGAAADFARRIVKGVQDSRTDLDTAISKFAQNWALNRMAVIDRNILRLGAWEMANVPETPPSVVINEAIELAKRFSTAQSGKFINGILDTFRASTSKQDAPADQKTEE